ncbi:MAG: hypothetical protein A3K19_03985 [Lentisphaerae bacterium RIFOXYB12_FULL_65_16]|nr:MAG: hypothetical protein A3K18_14155 [Lentisphaerae bacterium RIFOXYA12_64_32]OGV85239.1 MAG: hypothetical protein A3K19_03985 [Lentisphaerae bacterium RIFOXYB12_FULL_65_16]
MARLWTRDFYAAIEPTVVQAGFHKATPGWRARTPQRPMPDYDLWYVAAGKGGVLINDAWVPFADGDLISIKPGDRYREEVSDVSAPFQIYYAHLLFLPNPPPDWVSELHRQWPLKISALHRPAVATLFAELFRTFTVGGDEALLRLKALALQILDQVFDEIRRPVSGLPPKVHSNLLRGRQLIEQEFAQDLRVEDIAAYAGVSPSYLCALFRRHLRVSPMEYLRQARVNESKLLLARGLPVKEVAAEVGFNSLHYFSRVFARRTGLPPSEFARRSQRRPPG